MMIQNNLTYKIITGIVLVVLVSLLGWNATTFYKKNYSDSSEKESGGTNMVDRYALLQSSNELFAQGVQESINGNHKEAIDLLKKSKENAKNNKEKAVIDFVIANNKVEIDRVSGVKAYINISKNENYSPRVRALAKNRAYLMYGTYSDIKVLRRMAKAYDISWSNRKDVVNTLMKQIYELYPLALPIVMIVENELDGTKDKQQALSIYNRYSKAIDNSINEAKLNSGEGTELTSSMLAKARLLSRLHLEFDAVPKTEVEKSYEDLITYDQEKNIKINMQYALLAYANFESSIKNYDKATAVMVILLSNPLEDALKESLPKINTNNIYTYLDDLSKNTKEASVKEFISMIGSANKKVN